MTEVRPETKDACGIGCFRPRICQKLADVRLFVALMCLVIAVQGTYLGYMVAVLTSIERRFEISSSKSGTLFAMYDIGHTLTVVLVGYLGADKHKPRLTVVGVLLSALAMLGLSLPNFIFGPTSKFEDELMSHHDLYVNITRCDPLKTRRGKDATVCDQGANNGAFAILAVSQVLAGVAAAPFNTLAYIYIDDNVSTRQSPFYLGLLTSMYAFGPAFGFALGALCTHLYAAPGQAPSDLDPSSPNWVGAWWLGFQICCVLYLVSALPLLLFPKYIPSRTDPSQYPGEAYEMERLQRLQSQTEAETRSTMEELKFLCHAIKGLPMSIVHLLLNPIYSTMVVGWIFGAYLVGGYGTYLPKYIETQYGQTASMADVYAGVITIGSVAVSTAVGGYILTRFDIHPRTATLFLIGSWCVLLVTYLLGMSVGCTQPKLQGKLVSHTTWNFITSCNERCKCEDVIQFEPVCAGNVSFFSPCHAGCSYDNKHGKWINCQCTVNWEAAEHGFCPLECEHLPIYLVIMFIGLFLGNVFFMTTMMVVLRCVDDDQKSLALSFASCATNILGFIPSPIIFGTVIDTACVVWHSLCSLEMGNCILYDNEDFRHKYHLGNAGFQLLAILAVTFTYFKARRFKFPEDELDELSRASGVSNRQTEPPE